MNFMSVCALVCAVAVLLTLPYYCKITFHGKTKKTLRLKLFQSSMFVLAAVFSLVSAENYQPFAYVMTAGFCLSLVGDYFLGKGEGSKLFLIGAAFFASAHCAYITAFSMAIRFFFYDIRWLNLMEISLYMALICAIAIICLIRNPRFHKLFVPMFIYFGILCLMVTKAFGLGVRLAALGEPTELLLPIGAFLFLCSDMTLSMMRYKMAKRTLFMRSFSSCTYFIGQTLMALSIMFIK
ncbi:MAG: lysoplasmalogenase [Clostridia bacterium]|nr:lysoplasmalogenase [Clostridia bacterium]